ncbi:hypothetical protein N7467_009819 [Penicillium canescens]|nr:hypothetical protein N7467_009819 [Penicillium canescens]
MVSHPMLGPSPTTLALNIAQVTAPTPCPPTPRSLTPRSPTPRAPTPRAPTPRAPTPRAPTPRAPTPRAPTPRAPTPRAPTPRAPTPRAPTPRAPTPRAPTPAAPLPANSSSRATLLAEENLPDGLRALSLAERRTAILTGEQIQQIAFFAYSVRAQFHTIWTTEGMLRAQYRGYAEGLHPRIRRSNLPRPPRGSRRE